MRVRALLSVVLGLVVVGGCTSTAGAPSSTSSPTSGSTALPAPSSSAGAPSSSGSGVPADVGAARAGLARWIADNKPATPTTSTDIPGCPAIALSDVQESLAPVGLTATLQDWGTEIEWNEYEEIDPDLIGIACGGDTDGNSHDSKTGTAFGLIAVDLTGKGTFQQLVTTVGLDGPTEHPSPSLPGGTVQVTCQDGSCIALWHDGDGLVLALTLQGDVAPDAASSAKVMDVVGPQALVTLAGL